MRSFRFHEAKISRNATEASVAKTMLQNVMAQELPMDGHPVRLGTPPELVEEITKNEPEYRRIVWMTPEEFAQQHPKETITYKTWEDLSNEEAESNPLPVRWNLFGFR